jgi:hypothetical protein
MVANNEKLDKIENPCYEYLRRHKTMADPSLRTHGIPRVTLRDRALFEASCFCITLGFSHRLPIRALLSSLQRLGVLTKERKSLAFYIADLLTSPIHGMMSDLAMRLRESAGGNDFVQLLHAWRALDRFMNELLMGNDEDSIFEDPAFQHDATRAGPYLAHVFNAEQYARYIQITHTKQRE